MTLHHFLRHLTPSRVLFALVSVAVVYMLTGPM